MSSFKLFTNPTGQDLTSSICNQLIEVGSTILNKNYCLEEIAIYKR